MNEYEKLKESLSADKALDAATAEALLEKYPFLSIAASRALLNPVKHSASYGLVYQAFVGTRLWRV